MLYFFSYIVTLFSLLTIDGIWLLLVMSKIYQRNLPHLLADRISWWPAAIFYLFYAFGIGYFVIWPTLEKEVSYWSVFSAGIILGLIAYSAYDLTNQATLRGWPIFITIVDIAWGGAFSGVVAVISFAATKAFTRFLDLD